MAEAMISLGVAACAWVTDTSHIKNTPENRVKVFGVSGGFSKNRMGFCQTALVVPALHQFPKISVFAVNLGDLVIYASFMVHWFGGARMPLWADPPSMKI